MLNLLQANPSISKVHMANAAITTEELTKAHHGAGMVAADLRAALAAGTPVEALVLLPLIQRANELSRDIEQLLFARTSAE